MSKRKTVITCDGDEIVYGITKGQVKRQYRYMLKRRGRKGLKLVWQNGVYDQLDGYKDGTRSHYCTFRKMDGGFYINRK